jgi:hypothetical protein
MMIAFLQTAVSRAIRGTDDEEESFLTEFAFRSLVNVVSLNPITGTVWQELIRGISGKYTTGINAPLLQQLDKWSQAVTNIPDDTEEVGPYFWTLILETGSLLGSGWANLLKDGEKIAKQED